MTEKINIIFVRHGQSTQNLALELDQEYDRDNIVLTRLGIKQAEKTGKYINEIYGKIDMIYLSPIKRCNKPHLS
jgi:broad specificity phosphatase PhoE